jgi:outer membrane receptor protein involved in Fe transport
VRTVRAIVVGLGLLLPTVALADPKDDARRRFQQGVALARSGDLDGAIDRFLEADALFPHPATTYNIAFAYQQLGQLEEAVRWYERLAEQAPGRADEVAAILAELNDRLAARQAPPEPGAAPGSAALVAGEIARLRELAAELEALAARVAERGPVAGPGGEGPAVSAGEGTSDEGSPDGEGAAALEQAGFQGDAYERVVVTASRYGQEPIDSPSTVSVLTADDIALSAATTVPDLLRRVVGVNVMSMSAGQPEVSIRGFNRELNNKVLVLIDGRSVYWDFIGTTQWSTFPIALEEIERIEVIRGPGSAVYGANAVTGVVNIITRTPGETPETRLVAEAGTPGYVRGSAYTTGRAGETSYRFSAGYQQHGRWSKTDDPSEEANTFFFPDQNLAERSVRAHGRVDRALGEEAFISLSGGYVDSQAELYNIGVLGNYGRSTDSGYARADATVGPVHGRVFYNRVSGTTGPWAARPVEAELLTAGFVAQTFDAEVEAFGDFETGPVSHRINGGVGYRRKAIDDFAYLEGDIIENHYNAFINEEASLDPVKLVVSLRADRHPLIDLSRTLSPRAAAILRLGDRSLRVGGGTAFRVPTLVESYMDIELPTDVDGVFVRDFGSRELVPERIVTAELGFFDQSTLYHSASVTLYYNRVTRLIGLAPLTGTFEPFDPSVGGLAAGQTGWVNLPDVYHGVGIEAEGELYPTDGLDLFANVSVQRILQDSPGESLKVDGSTSLVQANGGIQYRTPFRIDLSMTGHFVSAQTWGLRAFDDDGDISITDASIPARFLLSGRLAFRPLPGEGLELSVSGWNLAAAFADDLRFREHPRGQLVGARVFGGIGYTF